MSTRGFTLLELLVVLAIFGLVMGLAVPRLSGAITGPGLANAARDVAAELRHARSQAVTTNREVSLVVDQAARRFGIPGNRRTGGIPDDIDVTIKTAASERLTGTAGGIRFFPDGSSTGGRITLAAGPRQTLIDVDWLIGRVDVSE